jgi:hypothetical protein
LLLKQLHEVLDRDDVFFVLELNRENAMFNTAAQLNKLANDEDEQSLLEEPFYGVDYHSIKKPRPYNA